MRPGLNSRPSLHLLKYTINPRPLNGTGFHLEEASIRGNTVYIYIFVFCLFVFTSQLVTTDRSGSSLWLVKRPIDHIAYPVPFPEISPNVLHVPRLKSLDILSRYVIYAAEFPLMFLSSPDITVVQGNAYC